MLICSTEAPEVFGMHANANIAFQLQETRTLVDTVLSIQPRVGGGGDGGSGGNSTDATVAALAQQILQELPADLDPGEAASGLHDRAPDGKLNSLSVVLSQEVERWVAPGSGAGGEGGVCLPKGEHSLTAQMLRLAAELSP